MTRVWNLAAVLAIWSGQAMAWTGTVDWPTFYRSGPDKQYGVLDEVQRGQRFEVLSCDGDWCKVQDGRSLGYIERGALAPQAPLPVASTGKPDNCFESRSAGYNKGEVFRYCGPVGK